MINKLDIIVFGATGFTGKHVVLQLHKYCNSYGINLTWGIAGRSQQKLEAVLNEAAKETGDENLKTISIFLADVNNETSLTAMVCSARVIINCCGPYSLYGEAVVKSCIEHETHLLDITAELDYIAKVHLEYAEQAATKNVYIINSCGIDCVPTDLGVVFLQDKFKGILNSVRIYTYASGLRSDGYFGRSQINIGTWNSLVQFLGDIRTSYQTLRKFNDQKLPTLTPKLSLKSLIHKSPAGKWAIPSITSDYNVIKRSQRYFYDAEEKRPVQTHVHFQIDCLFVLVLIALLFFFDIILSQFRCGRKLLLKYPSIFSGKFVSHNPPVEEDLKKSLYVVTLYGNGWHEGTPPEQLITRAPQKNMTCEITVVDPGYDFTSAAVTLCAIVLLTEQDRLPNRGGVYTPAAAFSKTSLIEKLQKHGFTFKVIP